MPTTDECPEPPGSTTVPPPPPPVLPVCCAAAACAAACARAAACCSRRLMSGLDAGGHLLELALEALDLGLVLRGRRDELGGRLLVGVELDPPVLDVLTVGRDALDGVDVAVAQPLHEIELGHEVVEAVGGEEDVDDADVTRLVDVLGPRRELLVGDVQVVLGDLEQPLVLLDLRLDGGELRGGLVVLLHGHVDLVVDALQLGLHLAQLCFLAADGRGERGGGEGEGEEEGAEKDRERDDPSFAVHCIASFWAPRLPRTALVEVSPHVLCTHRTQVRDPSIRAAR